MAWQSVDVSGESPNQILRDTTSARFMAGVYRWMFGGLLLTSVVSFLTLTQPALLQAAIGSFRILLFVELGVVLGFSFLASRVSGPVAALLFLGYAALNGVTFGVLFTAYQLGSVFEIFLLTSVVFGAMSLYGTLTKKDLSAWATFLFMGLIGVIGAGVINIFMRSSGLSFVASCATVVVFSGLTAYDNQKLRTMHANSGYNSATSLTIVGALTLYLDFINLFLALLRLFGRRR